MSFFLIERHLLASLHRVVNLRANSVFTILALCLTLVCTSGINEPLTGKGIQKNDVCPRLVVFSFIPVHFCHFAGGYVEVRYIRRFVFYFLLF